MICRTILNETSYFGKGAIKEIANEVINRGLKKVMLVTDKDLPNASVKPLNLFMGI